MLVFLGRSYKDWVIPPREQEIQVFSSSLRNERSFLVWDLTEAESLVLTEGNTEGVGPSDSECVCVCNRQRS